MRSITVEERRARLAGRHLLLPETRNDDAPAIADALVALHSSDPVTVYLSVLARMVNPSVAAVEAALYDDRSLVRHHALRRTLWVATPEVVRLLHASASRALVTAERARMRKALAAAGVEDPETWLGEAGEQALADLRQHGPSAARDVGRRVEALRQPIVLGSGRWEQTVAAHTRVLLGLGFAGEVLRTRPLGTWASGAYRYAAADTWLPEGVEGVEERDGRARLVRRYLERFGPVTTVDVSWWTGSTAAATRAALTHAGAEEIDADGVAAWVAPGDAARVADPGPWVAALPSLDPTTMGWKQRSWYLPAVAADAFDRNGNAGPTLWVDGRVVGAWAQAPDGRMLTHFFERVATSRRAELDEGLRSLAAAVGDTRYTVRFPGRIHPVILASEPTA